ncbi:MAG TPA: dTDP-4-dehydrorhamnose 3,5-epimerase [Solirubrobacteraceae bacterium]|nr:dTDP-4-dehydrorhamnose 3,5-epimerase [Solirubrobacteraceae bacterium]
MRFTETPLAGVCVVEPERLADERGWFARTFDADQFAARGMSPAVAQCSASFNGMRDTLRGMHYQAEPYGEPKLVRCVRGAIFDVAIDLRPGSETYCSWHGIELSAESGLALYVPAGLAHGFQTLADTTEVLYQMGSRHEPQAARGVRWDDPAFAIEWPAPRVGRVISERDLSYPDFQR